MSDPSRAYEASTRDILVRVRAYFLDDQSEPDNGKYVWAYRVSVENHGADTVQLMRRSWRITRTCSRPPLPIAWCGGRRRWEQACASMVRWKRG